MRGMRAMSVGVDAVTGTAGLIWPGDRVDLILTEATANPAVPADRRISAETVLANVRVIAIDQRLVEGARPGAKTGHAAQTVTLEVTAAEAERVAVATKLGRLSLAVRAAEAGTAPPQRPVTVWAGDVAPALKLRPAPSAPSAVRLWLGAAGGKEIRF